MVADPLPQVGHLTSFSHSVGGHLVKKAGSAKARPREFENAYKNPCIPSTFRRILRGCVDIYLTTQQVERKDSSEGQSSEKVTQEELS